MRPKKINQILFPDKRWTDYELLDSGNHRKLERFGDKTLIRPDPRAVWKPKLLNQNWQNRDAEFVLASGKGGVWQQNTNLSEWTINCLGLKLKLEISNSMQIGIFPENYSHWVWLKNQINSQLDHTQEFRVLNLFGYTGVASLIAAASGAAVTHIDSSKRSIRMGRMNAELSGIQDKPIRWMVDDAMKFLNKEIRRGNKYHGIIMDPPQYGLGPRKEKWKFSAMFTDLCDLVRKVLEPEPAFVVLTAYELDAKPDHLINDFGKVVDINSGQTETGFLGISDIFASKTIKLSQYIRWSRK